MHPPVEVVVGLVVVGLVVVGGVVVGGAEVGAGVEIVSPISSTISSHIDVASPLPSIKRLRTSDCTGLAALKENVYGTKTTVLPP